MSNLKILLERIYNKPIREILRELYIEQDMSYREMAKELNVNYTTVRNWVKEEELHKIRSSWDKNLSPEEKRRILELENNS